jgi:hypothetical protein
MHQTLHNTSSRRATEWLPIASWFPCHKSSVKTCIPKPGQPEIVKLGLSSRKGMSCPGEYGVRGSFCSDCHRWKKARVPVNFTLS